MKVLKIILVLVVCMVVVLAVVGILIAVVGFAGKDRVARRVILEANFEQTYVEYATGDRFSRAFFGETPQVRDVVEALEQAATDDKVVGLIARIGAAPLGMAKAQEFRDAVLAFRESGKPAIAFSETFGEVGPGNVAYYLASAFDQIYLQPSGDIGLTGLIMESPFLRGTFDKLGIEPRMGQRYEYKNAMNMYTETEFTEAQAEVTQSMVDSHFNQIIRGISEGRGMPAEKVVELIDMGPLFGVEGEEAGLVDGLLYRDEVYENFRDEVGEDAELLYLARYLERAGRPHDKGATVALIHGLGPVVRGASSFDPVMGSSTMGSDTVAGALRAAIDDNRVDAIVFRVDSPGGSYVASDAIWRETVRARDAGKPVIVTMGSVAASGGYFVAMSADKIVAQPGTLTGSIGVLGGKLLTTGLWEKLGISWDEAHAGANATIWSGTEDYSEAEWERFETWLDRVYEDFTSKVAEGRHLPLERVREIAKGRVWTGEQAKEIGLVDELGGFSVALRLVREAAGLEPDAPIRLKLFPKPKTPFEQLFGDPSQSSESSLLRVIGGGDRARMSVVLQQLTLWAQQAGLLESDPGVLRTGSVYSAK